MSTNTLQNTALDRKARLAQLRSLKRKQPEPEDQKEASTDVTAIASPTEHKIDTSKYLSGRNFDPTTRNAKLGFENDPLNDTTATLEKQAAILEKTVLEEAVTTDAQADEPLDLFKLQPKKPNWDLKRELAARMNVLDVRTENAIARLVRERIEKQNNKGGLEGADLVEAANVMEREEEEEERRDAEWARGLAD